MSCSGPVAWLRRVCLTDYGYNFALPALVVASAVLSQAVIRKISFTEIDFQTYVGQAALFQDGERDYSKLDPEGGSGPCVYPAVHLYVYSFFNWLTRGGKNISPAQHVFALLQTANALAVALLYRQAGMPPIAVLPLILSKRIHSIFLLRMFNDPVAIFCVYIALFAAINSRWSMSALLFSVGLGIKMNVLLFLPGIAAAAFAFTGFAGAVSYVTIIAVVQLLVSLPFTMHDAEAYLSHAFDFSRAFLHVWTVNWRFVPEKTFLSKPFAHSLLGLHLGLLLLFGLFRWTAIAKQGPRWTIKNLKPRSCKLTQHDKAAILSAAFSANVIGILCSRSLHYQFYSWYFHQVPLLLWFSKLPMVVKLALPVALEWCWNVFPSTDESSMLLLVCHSMLVLACFTLPGLVARNEGATKSAVREADEDEVDALLAAEGSEIRADETTASDDEEAEAEAEAALERAAATREAKAAKKAKEQEAFRRRIATRRRLLGMLGKLSLLLRPLLVLAAVILMFMVPHPSSPVSKGTYVDENALQPGQARVYWDYFDVTYADMLSEKVGYLGAASSEVRADFVYSELQSYGLEVNRQDYAFDSAKIGDDSALKGTNVYARSATPRIDGREAIILTASWRSSWKGENDPFPSADNSSTIDPRGRINVRGVASLLALSRYLQTQSHLSKDLIFVVSDGHLEGIHAWASAYFGSVQDGLTVDPVAAGGSQVWNAISMDYPADSFSSLEVQYEGFDGQLPNMDVVNTVVRVIDTVAGGMPVNLGGKSEKKVLREAVQGVAKKLGVKLRRDVEYELGNYEDGVRAALRQVGFGVSGQASGPHGFFQRHHVDAVTLYAVPATGPYGFFHMGRLIESFVRSMSNLLERLHHSQFFYLLLNPRRFVPIGTAILIPLLISIALTISGMALWFGEEKVSKIERETVLASLGIKEVEGDVQPETPTIGWYREQVVKHLLDPSVADAASMDKHADTLRESMRPVGIALTCAGSTVVLGSAVLYHCDKLTSGLSGDATNATVTAASLAFLLLPEAVALILRSQSSTKRARRVGSLLLAFAYMQAGMLVAVLSVLNFALAAVLGLLTYSALRVASGRPTAAAPAPANALTQSARGLAVTLFSPILWALVAQGLQRGILAGPTKGLMEHWRLFGSATVPILCVAYVPIVLQAQIGALLKR